MRFAITVPSVSTRGKIDHAKLLAGVRRKMCAIFGGCTSVAAQGSWVDENGVLVEEDVTVVHSLGEPSELKGRQLRELAEQLCSEAMQDCVLIEVGSSHEFVTSLQGIEQLLS